ncbi:MAG: dTDP-4-dehydrorhamnose reductase [Alphaproteobacteria bacterium]|nr:dTDP-4-dehydrorhamnose reductase [Alphaproteobacteria bacterium]
MTFRIFGADGQVGRAIAVAARRAGIEVVPFDHRAVDIRDAAALRASIGAGGVAINAAAWTDVDGAEEASDAAFAVNRDGAGLLARVAAEKGVPVLHFSTDYVFDGRLARPYREDDPVGPLSVYGRSKAEGEAAVRLANPRHVILRCSWVHGARGRNFVRTMLRLGAEREEIAVIDDQKGGPTAAEDIAGAALAVLEQALRPGFEGWGTYHFQGRPVASWADFAEAILAGRGHCRIRRIASADYPTLAKRPLNGVLDCARIEQVFGIRPPDWRRSLARVLAEIDGERAA